MSPELKSIVALAATLPKREITAPDGSLYLTRYALKGDFALDSDTFRDTSAVYLHHFHRPDGDRDLHSHPWPWSNSTILHGAYYEKRNTEFGLRQGFDASYFTYGVGDVNAFTEGDYHTILDIAPDTWTLFATGPVDHKWDFWVPGEGKVHWKEYLRRLPGPRGAGVV
jgi:hypothetical protein